MSDSSGTTTAKSLPGSQMLAHSAKASTTPTEPYLIMAVNDTPAAGASHSATLAATPPDNEVADCGTGDTAMDPPTQTSSQTLALPVISKLLKGKEREWSTITSKEGPLHLLDLPIDILGLVVTEVQHINDLTSLALTNSTLYNLAIPFIYSHFDIVWPDATSHEPPSKGVDALTYGLSTLCLGSRFSQRSRWLRQPSSTRLEPSQRLANNQYATYIRKFSIGNGLERWTSEYAVGQDAGKMLGTLVAIAVGKMINLETFIWDMPTGVFSDVFMALASLQDHYPEGEHKLVNVWVRWHNNANVESASSVSSGYNEPNHVINFFNGDPPQPPSNTNNFNLPSPPSLVPKDPVHLRFEESKVEYPTFSILPALHSLTVLDIDEVAYLDEMAQLIERSRFSLRELRIGLSSLAITSDFNQLYDSVKFDQVDRAASWPGESQIGEKRLGGVLGIVFGRVFDLKSKRLIRPAMPQIENDLTSSIGIPANTNQDEVKALSPGAEASNNSPKGPTHPGRLETSGRLMLQTLELEKLRISVPVVEKAVDWPSLTTLTILDCIHHESLWRMLRKQFPVDQPPNSTAESSRRYPLSIKNIHTDQVSSALMTFLKDNLAPNTLEGLFLQARRNNSPPAVKLSQIMKGPIKRHRSSLRKLLLDSVYFKRHPLGSGLGRSHWALSSSWVSFLTSGRMANLRELSVAFDARAWHPFLRGFPNIPELRTLHVLGVPNRANAAAQKERAVQVVDVLSLRPESKLCYFGIGDACFEIMEAHTNKDSPPDIDFSGHVVANGVIVVDPGSEVDTSATSSSESEPLIVNAVHPPPVMPMADGDDIIQDPANDWSHEESSVIDSDAESYSGSDDGEHNGNRRWLYLHEISFYDDKVDVFRARHAKLGGGVEHRNLD